MRFVTAGTLHFAAGLLVAASMLAPREVAANQLPVFTSTPSPVADAGREYRYDARATDADGQTPSYELVQAPAGATLDASTGTLRWRAKSTDLGNKSFSLRALDGAGGSAVQTFTLRVREDFCPIYPIALPLDSIAPLVPGARVTRLPRGVGTGNFSWLSWTGATDTPTLAQSLTPPGNSDYYLDPDDATDRQLDLGDYVQGAPGSMNASTVRAQLEALLTRDIILPVWEIKREAGGRLDYRIAKFASVRLLDFDLTGHGWLSFEYRGDAVCYNQKPIATPQALQTDEDTPLPITLRGTDAHGDALAFRITAPPEHGVLSGSGAQLVYTPAADFHGSDRFVIVASDGQLDSAPATIDLSVQPVNDAPLILTESLPGSAAVGLPYTTVITARDPDGDTALRFELVAPPTGATIDAASGELRWTPTTGQDGTAAITVRVVDAGGLGATREFTLAVAANGAPTFTTTPVTAVTEGQAYSYDADAVDPDGDTVHHELLSAPSGMQLAPATGLLQWTPSASDVGDHTIHIQASDGRGGSAVQEFTLHVASSNRAPVITSTAPLSGITGSEYRYDVDATDADGDTLVYALTAAPTGMTIDAASGVISWTPSTEQVGATVVTVQVSDGRDGGAEQSFTLTIAQSNRAPVITSTAPLTGMTGSEYRYDVDATDADGDTLRFTLEAAPSGMTIDIASGLINWTPSQGQAGDHSVEIRVTDGADGVAEQTFTLHVTALNRGPAITSTAPTRVDEGQTLRYPILATDPDTDALAYRAAVAPAGTEVSPTSGVLTWLADDARLIGSLRVPNTMCRTSSTASTFDPVLSWHWDASAVEPSYRQVMMAPLVVQTSDDNGDGRIDDRDQPDVVIITHAYANVGGDGIIRILDGTTGRERVAITEARARVTNYAHLAAADIDGDGFIEFVGPRSGGGLVAIEHDGAVKWTTQTPAWGWSIGAPAIADLDGDGSPEIIYGNTVHGADGSLKWLGTGAFVGTNHVGYSKSPLSVVADITADPGLEVVAGPSLYSADGRLLWEYAAVGDGVSALADLDADGKPEIVVAASRTVVALRANGTVLWGPIALPDGGRGGPPTIADVDGDGRPEIGIASQTTYYVFDHEGKVQWTHAIVDMSSNMTGSTVFDFEADGAAEILQQDEYTLRVFDGRTGRVRWEIPNASGTAFEYPLVADVDRDGSADILVSSNLYLGGSQTGLRMFSSASRSWAPTRSLWNQHAYHIDNINDDGSVPRQPSKSWLTHNTFRLNTFPDRHPLGLADLALFDLRLSADGTALEVLVTNRGLAPTAAPTTVRLFNGDPEQGGTLLGTLAVPVLAAGEERTLTLSGLISDSIDTDVFAKIDEANAIVECLDDNNTTGAAYFDVRATDPSDLFDRQRFTVTVENVNEAPTILTTTLPPAGISATYRYRVLARDEDRGDSLRYELIAAPTGMTIDAVSGELRWAPLAAQAGTHAVRVRVTDLGGLSAERSFELLATVTTPPQNQAPAITSVPATSVDERRDFTYDVDAVDPDTADLLRFSLDRSPGASIDAATGLVRWTASSAVAGIRAPLASCRVAPPPASAFDPELRWHWSGSTTMPDYDQVMMTPLVVQATDDNGDGAIDAQDRPDVVFISYQSEGRYGDGVVRVVDSATGQDIFTVTDPRARLANWSNLAAGDIDGDGRVEFIGLAPRGGIVALEHDGTFKWVADRPYYGWSLGAPAIADLDGDGRPEIVIGSAVLNADGSLKWIGTGNWIGSNQGQITASPLSFAADVTADPGLEVVAGASVYTAGGRLLWQHPTVSDGFSAVADLDGDGAPEVVVIATSQLTAFRSNGSVLWGPTQLADGWLGGAPTIADFNGDGRPEIGIANKSYYHVIDADGTELWRKPITDGSSASTGSTSFDFDGDGAIEIVQADESNLRVMNGRTGETIWSTPNANGTALEYPVVVDADKDGSADILVPSNKAFRGTQTGLRMFSSASRRWMPTRSIWNQHAYHIDNVNDDGTIPRQPAKSWLSHNTFRLNTYADRHALDRPDLAVFDLRLAGNDGAVIELQVANRGLAPTIATTQVRVYNGDPADGGSLLGALTVPVLAARATETLTLAGLDAALVTRDLYAVVDESDTLDECIEDNNVTAATLFQARVTDPAGQFDTQRFTVSIENVNEAPVIETAALPAARLGEDYRQAILAIDPDAGDGLHFAIEGAPEGMHLDSLSGELTWSPTVAQLGSHEVMIRVTDLGGLTASRTLTIVVRTPADNAAPAFTSAPVTTVTLGSEYRYDANANDADGDTLSFAFVGPVGMQIESTTGLVTWTPTATGEFDVALRVSDGRGGQAEQAYSLRVIAANAAPRIDSTPVLGAKTGVQYTYAVLATDPDGDALAYSLAQAPGGMSIDAAGVVRFVPGAQQLGTHAVRVRVADARGAFVEQSYTLTVTQRDDNRPPTITSLPFHFAKVGKTYRYAATATDPDGDPLAWSLVDPPAGAQVDAQSGLLTFVPTQTGPVEFVLRATDGDYYADQSWTVTVLDASFELGGALDLTPDPVAPGGTLNALLVVSGAAGPVTVEATLDGQPITLAVNAYTTLTAPLTPGAYRIALTLSDGYDTVPLARTFHVIDPNDTSKPTATIHEPLETADEEILVVTAPRPVKISVADDALLSWTLRLFERGAPGSEAITLASGTEPVSHAHVAKLDPTLLENGQYALILDAKDQSGNVTQDVVALSIEGAMKLGHFSLSFEDLSLPVAGLPVSVTRTYDTRQRHRAMDFGYGWSLAYRSVKVQESRRPGFGWQLRSYPTGPLGLIPKWCIESARGNVVSVTRPDGKVEKFRAVASPACNEVFALFEVDLHFEPMDGTQGKLVALNDLDGRFINNALADAGSPDVPLDPSNYRYVDAEGLEYTVDQSFGLRQLHERPGDNTITFDRDGIVHSNGTSVSFVRDAAGRVSKIVAPDQSERSYEYDADGNLAAVVDFGGGRTQFTYLAGHYLQDIIDARGVRVARNEYDDDGRLVAVIDADGKRVEYTRNIEGRVEQVKDRRGNTTTYVYNDRGDVLAETNALQQTTERTYDADGNELSQTDPLDRTQRWTYDALGNVLTETNAEGETTTSVYGKFNQLTETRDPAGRVQLRSTYRNQSLPGSSVEIYPGPLVSIEDASGAETRFGYDSATGELNLMVDGAGAMSRFEVDAKGYKLAETDALGHRTTYVNDDLGRVTEERRSRTNAAGVQETLTTRYTYDAAGRVTATEHPDGSVTRTEYNAAGQVTAEVDALGRRTTHTYNDRGEEVETGYPDGTSETKSFDANGNVIAQTDRGGRTTKFVFDAANRLVETIHPDADAADADDSNNPRSRSVYDAAGQLIESIDEDGHSTQYAYDDAGRRIRTILTAVDGASATITDAYDATGRRTSSTDAEGHVTTYRYDTGGRLIETEQDGAVTSVDYDAVGRKLADTDALGRVTRYGYDALGRLTTVVLPNPQTGANPALVNGQSPDAGTLTTRYIYDELGNKTQQIDAEGRITRWEYDRMGRETARILPAGQRETKQYNLAGELIAQTDFEGKTTRYLYDTTGRAEAIDYPNDPDVGFGYNAAGERTQVTDGRGTSTMQFDRRGRVVQAHDADGGLIEYSYDAAGNLLSRVSPSQSLVYTYDARHRMTTVTRTVDGEAPMVTRYEYDQDGNRTAMLGGDGLRTEYAYDRKHRLTNLIKKTTAGAMLLAMQYTVDASGMRTAVTEQDTLGTSRTVEWSYDATKRLTREAIDHRDTDKDRISAWTYDDVGNRLTQTVTIGASTTESTTYVYDANDRLLSESKTGGSQAGATAYTYDDNGNTRSKTGPGGATTYRYDDANRLIEAVTPEGTSSYVYTADGLRVRQTHTPLGGTATTTWYVQDTGYPYAQVIEEYTSTATTPKTLAATFTFADDLVSQTRYTNGTPATQFIQSDGFGSTRWLTNAAGAVTDTIDYDAFGKEVERAGQSNVQHLYRGEAFDANVGLYYLRARWMNAELGRFTQVDPFPGFAGIPTSLHDYSYVANDPVNEKDPSGLTNLMEQTMVSRGIATTLRTGVSSFRPYVNRALTYAIRTSRAARDAARQCFRSRKSCPLAVPVLVVGQNFPNAAQHIEDSQRGNSEALTSSGFMFTYLKRKKTDWYKNYMECSGSRKLAAMKKFAGPVACDEFPFFASRQGGPENYPARVSLRYIPYVENQIVGLLYAGMVSSSRMQTNDKFLVFADAEAPVSFFIPVRKSR